MEALEGGVALQFVCKSLSSCALPYCREGAGRALCVPLALCWLQNCPSPSPYSRCQETLCSLALPPIFQACPRILGHWGTIGTGEELGIF